ncbi:hypothetical protein Pla163_36690 [Planctomycetes bacterium Pla163]|uniref:Uncharacterized protein n=1 Tax=Rohdeia mirabilis TaxID=2528008 RepID=A0A518D4X4_9BACT|nr:hypothetical protein Pla163_36690 [Planctomycetes bacterium Pla163]
MSEPTNDERAAGRRGRALPFERVEAAAHAALDAGRDPLGDEAVLAALVDAPEAFEHVVRLAQDANELTRLAPAIARPASRRRLAPFAAAAALVLIAVAVAVALAPKSAEPVDPSDDVVRGDPRERAADTESVARDDEVAAAPDSRTTATSPTAVVESLSLTVTTGPPEARETIALTRRPGQTHTTLTRSVHGLSPTGDVVLLTTEERLP